MESYSKDIRRSGTLELQVIGAPILFARYSGELPLFPFFVKCGTPLFLLSFYYRSPSNAVIYLEYHDIFVVCHDIFLGPPLPNSLNIDSFFKIRAIHKTYLSSV